MAEEKAKPHETHDYLSLSLSLMLNVKLEEKRTLEVLNHLHGTEPKSRGCIKCKEVQETLIEMNESLKNILNIISH